MHKSKTAGLKQKVAQEEGNAAIGPATVHEQQPLQKPELGQAKVRILHRLTPFHTGQSHSNMSSWCRGAQHRSIHQYEHHNLSNVFFTNSYFFSFYRTYS